MRRRVCFYVSAYQYIKTTLFTHMVLCSLPIRKNTIEFITFKMKKVKHSFLTANFCTDGHLVYFGLCSCEKHPLTHGASTRVSDRQVLPAAQEKVGRNFGEEWFTLVSSMSK